MQTCLHEGRPGRQIVVVQRDVVQLVVTVPGDVRELRQDDVPILRDVAPRQGLAIGAVLVVDEHARGRPQVERNVAEPT